MPYGREMLALATMALGSVLTPPVAGTQEPVGYVAEVHGRWRLVGTAVDSLAVGHLVPPGAIIRPPARYSRADHISIALRTDTRLDHDCSVPGECNADVRLPELPREEGPLGRVVAAVMSILPRRPARYQPLISRSARLVPAVLALDGTMLNVQPLLGGSPAGGYQIEVRQIGDEEGGPEPLVETLDVTWIPGRPSAVPVRAVAPGLYRVVMVLPVPGETWILVQDSARYAAVAARFAEAARLTVDWSVEVGDGPREALLRAYLEYLARGEP